MQGVAERLEVLERALPGAQDAGREGCDVVLERNADAERRAGGTGGGEALTGAGW